MARGQNVPVGTTRTSQNGYHYTKVEDDGSGKPGWRLTHHLVAEKHLGRKLREDERVSFKGKKTDLRWENIIVSEKGQGSQRRRKAQLEARIAELQAELDEIDAELQGGRQVHHSA
jgi:uncharacterized protein YgiM (DUF1202 family)